MCHAPPDRTPTLGAALRAQRSLLLGAALFGAFVNLLMLTGPLFMLQVYDRVLSSRSEETLLALFLLVAALYAAMGLLDYARGRVMGRVAARLGARLEEAVMRASLRDTPRAANGPEALDAVQRLLGAPVMLALFDLPWTPLFMAMVFLFHPLLGTLALAGAAVIVALALAAQAGGHKGAARAALAGSGAARMAGNIRAEAAMLRSLSMTGALTARWRAARAQAARLGLAAGDRAGALLALSRSFRLFLQSAMLALGALLVLRGELTPGAMIAASVLMGRALAPIDHGIGQWDLILAARRGAAVLSGLLRAASYGQARTALPRPEARLEVTDLTVVPPGAQAATLRLLSFTMAPGQALGVIGPSGAGKSTLARALCGAWPPTGGTVRLGGAALAQYSEEARARHIGHLPQSVILFEGTLAQNIARMAPQPDADAVIAAARRAGAHEAILRLPKGYDTQVTPGDCPLSGGQVQAVGLARALYGDPLLLVLDEPDAHLDRAGLEALRDVIRTRSAAGLLTVLAAHRPGAIGDCDRLLVLENGTRRALGPREEVLRQTVANHAALRLPTGTGSAP